MEFCTQSCASLALKLGRQEKVSVLVLSSQNSVLIFRDEHSSSRGEGCRDQDVTAKPPHTELLTEIEIQLEVVRLAERTQGDAIRWYFATKTAWTA